MPTLKYKATCKPQEDRYLTRLSQAERRYQKNIRTRIVSEGLQGLLA